MLARIHEGLCGYRRGCPFVTKLLFRFGGCEWLCAFSDHSQFTTDIAAPRFHLCRPAEGFAARIQKEGRRLRRPPIRSRSGTDHSGIPTLTLQETDRRALSVDFLCGRWATCGCGFRRRSRTSARTKARIRRGKASSRGNPRGEGNTGKKSIWTCDALVNRTRE